jgi:hypothetical protein
MRRSLWQLNAWLTCIRNRASVHVWWPILQAKLQGHYPYYGVSGSSRAISRYGYTAARLVRQWLHRRSQKKSFTWEGFLAYLRHYPLPRPRIVHRLYPSPRVGSDLRKSRMREIRTSGSVRGGDGLGQGRIL